MAEEAKYPRKFGGYLLLKKIAQGGMAEIFLAQAPDRSICAVKRILPHLASEENFIRMFIDEARIVSHLRHPNVASVREQGKEKGYYFIAMEFVQGHSLLALSEKAKATRMDLPRGLLAYVGAELLAGLGAAHLAKDRQNRSLGIVHRDVTPQNVLISYDGEVKLIDFGVAKAKSRLTQTEAGFTKGKLAYMSPEQAKGEELDGRSDLFSVGIILHEITTNARLFNKEGPGGVLGAIVNDPIPTPSSKIRRFPKELERIIMKALEKDVRRRYQHALEMQDDLLHFAKRERPKPSQSRLSALVQDLFGPPDSQAEIEAALGKAPPPVPEVREETRMVSRKAVRQERSVQVKSTQPRAPALDSAVLPVEPAVPEPAPPFKVKAARFLRDLDADVRLSWREHRKRWLSGLGALAALSFMVLAFFLWPLRGGSEKVSFQASPTPAVEEKPQTPQLRLVSEPPGALISLDGIGSGSVTPHTMKDFPVAKRVVVGLTLSGYRPVEEALTLDRKPGLRTERFILKRQVGRLRVKTVPPGATVRVDGTPLDAVTPLDVELDAGRPLQLVIEKRGFHSHTEAVLLVDGGETAVEHRLVKKISEESRYGRLDIDSKPSNCPVVLEGRQVGTTPLRGLKLKDGLHEVEVRCEFHQPELRYASVIAQSTSSLFVTAQPTAFGYLSIVPVPVAGTTVTINGRGVKTPVKFLKVVPGRHDVVVENQRLNATRRFSIMVKPNDRINRQVNLTF